MSTMAALGLPALLLLVSSLAAPAAAKMTEDSWLSRSYRRELIAEVGMQGWQHRTTLCDPNIVGSVAACYNSNIVAANIEDYPVNASEVAWPTDGQPWGFHITGPYPDGTSYLLSWFTGAPKVGSNMTMPDLSSKKSMVKVTTKGGSTTFTGKVICYMRNYTASSGNQAYNYLSPNINHVVLSDLMPGARYSYSVSDGSGKMVSTKYSFKALQTERSMAYPLRIGLIADVGQTHNSSQTRDHLVANYPDVIILTADNSYADNYAASSTDLENSNGTNQQRWDSYFQLWSKAYSNIPVLNCAGNHEIESSGIAAVINYTTTSFKWPTNFPFQSYSARLPVPGTMDNFGDITNNLYYSTVIGGVAKLITLNNYVPFMPDTPQYKWAVAEFKKVQRSVTPWLFVQFHAPPYHTYFTHYKEQECFMSVWEDIFYEAGVDMIFNGHVHAYERTHPVYKYKPNTCAPIYLTIGDGGNIEGPYRAFVDQVNILTNKTFCEQLTTSGQTPNQIAASNPGGWGPSYQRQAQPSSCNTVTFQPADGVDGGPVLVPKNGTSNLGFCQSSQPAWSASRDPSFGHAILELVSDTVAKFNWYKNTMGKAVKVDMVTLERVMACPNKS